MLSDDDDVYSVDVVDEDNVVDDIVDSTDSDSFTLEVSESSSSSSSVNDALPAQMPALQTNINSDFAIYIENKRQFSVGSLKFALVRTLDDIFTLDSSTIPCFRQVCITVLQPDMTGGTRFCDMRVHDIPGRMKFLAMSFLSKAFCNPALGSREEKTSFAQTPTAMFTYTATSPDHGYSRSFSKVYVSFEPLLHNLETTDGHALPIEQALDPLNVRGYRMWFFFADPAICPTRAIISAINEQKSEMGINDTCIAPSAEMFEGAAIDEAHAILSSSPGWAMRSEEEQAQRIQAKAGEVMMRRLKEVGTRVDRLNTQRRHSRQDFAKKEGSTSGKQLLRYEINSVSEFFDTVIVNEHTCPVSTCETALCDNCKLLTPIGDCFTSLDFEATTMNQSNILYRPLKTGCLARTRLNLMLNDPTPTPVRDLIDPTYHFSMSNPETFARCAMPGIEINPRQLSTSEYVWLDPETNLRYFAPPLPQYMFNYTAEKILHPEFMNLEFPWAIDYANFFLTLLESSVLEQNGERQRQLNTSILDNIVGGINNPDLVDLASFHKRWRPVLQMSSVSVGKEYEHTDITRKSMIPSRKIQEQRESRIVKIPDDFNQIRSENHEYIRRLQGIAQNLCPSDKKDVLRVIRAQGMRKFKSTFATTGNVTEIVRYCASYLDRIGREGKPIYYPIPPIAKNLPGPFANYVIRNFAHAEAIGIIALHDQFFMARQYAMRASHCNHTDELYGQTTAIPHTICFGVAAQGKSYLIDKVEEHTCPKTISIVSSSSLRAGNTLECQDDKVFVYDELRASIDPTQPNPSASDMQSVANSKERMTSFKLNHSVTDMGDSAGMGCSSVRDRRTLTIETDAHALNWMNGNDLRQYNQRELSWMSRHRIYYILDKLTRYGSMDLAGQGIRFGVGHIDTIINNSSSIHKQWCNTEYALHVAIAKAIKCGALPYPCMDVVAALWSLLYPRLKAKFPFVSKLPRVIERIASDALTFTINLAIYMVFNSALSPLHNINLDERTITDIPYNHDLLNLLQPYLGGNEEIGFYSIFYGVMTEIFPYPVWNAARAIAKEFGGNESAKPNFVQSIDVSAEQYIENQNYVNCGEISKIVDWMTKDFGHNEFTAIAMITRLEAMTMVCDWIVPGRPDLQTEKKEIHVALTVKSPNKLSTNEELQIKESTLYISRQFIKEANPERIIEFLLNAMCHKNIRRREIVIGCVYPQFPFLPQVVEIKPRGSHTVSVSQIQASREYIETALLGSKSITVEAVQRRKIIRDANMSRYVIDDGTDVESMLIRGWLESNAYLGPGVSVERYLPVNIERDLQAAHRLYQMEGKCQYPQDPIAEYRALDSNQPALASLSMQTTPSSASSSTTMMTDSEYEAIHEYELEELRRYTEAREIRSKPTSSSSSSTVQFQERDLSQYTRKRPVDPQQDRRSMRSRQE